MKKEKRKKPFQKLWKKKKNKLQKKNKHHKKKNKLTIPEFE